MADQQEEMLREIAWNTALIIGGVSTMGPSPLNKNDVQDKILAALREVQAATRRECGSFGCVHCQCGCVACLHCGEKREEQP